MYWLTKKLNLAIITITFNHRQHEISGCLQYGWQTLKCCFDGSASQHEQREKSRNGMERCWRKSEVGCICLEKGSLWHLMLSNLHHFCGDINTSDAVTGIN